jgi:hypothetical protein
MEASRIQLAAFAILLGAASSSQAVAGFAGADILESRLGARPEALGEAYTALGDDLAAVLYNPAGLAGITGPSLSFSHFAAIEQITYEDLAYGQPLAFGTVGLDFVLRDEPDINNPLATDNPVSANDIVLAGTYAQKPSYFFDNLPELLMDTTLGVNVKWVRSQLGQFTANDVAFDVGSRTDLGDGLMFGLAALNFGPPISFIQASDPLPESFNVGVSKHLELGRGNVLNTSVDFQYPLYSDSTLHMGLEDWIGKALALRVGYSLAQSNDATGLTAGLSLRLDQESLHFGLDYAYAPVYYEGFNSFDIQNLFSLNLGF